KPVHPLWLRVAAWILAACGDLKGWSGRTRVSDHGTPQGQSDLIPVLDRIESCGVVDDTIVQDDVSDIRVVDKSSISGERIDDGSWGSQGAACCDPSCASHEGERARCLILDDEDHW